MKLRQKLKDMEAARVEGFNQAKKAETENGTSKLITVKVTELERKALSDLTMRRDYLLGYYEDLQRVVKCQQGNARV